MPSTLRAWRRVAASAPPRTAAAACCRAPSMSPSMWHTSASSTATFARDARAGAGRGQRLAEPAARRGEIPPGHVGAAEREQGGERLGPLLERGVAERERALHLARLERHVDAAEQARQRLHVGQGGQRALPAAPEVRPRRGVGECGDGAPGGRLGLVEGACGGMELLARADAHGSLSVSSAAATARASLARSSSASTALSGGLGAEPPSSTVERGGRSPHREPATSRPWRSSASTPVRTSSCAAIVGPRRPICAASQLRCDRARRASRRCASGPRSSGASRVAGGVARAAAHQPSSASSRSRPAPSPCARPAGLRETASHQSCASPAETSPSTSMTRAARPWAEAAPVSVNDNHQRLRAARGGSRCRRERVRERAPEAGGGALAHDHQSAARAIDDRLGGGQRIERSREEKRAASSRHGSSAGSPSILISGRPRARARRSTCWPSASSTLAVDWTKTNPREPPSRASSSTSLRPLPSPATATATACGAAAS